MISIHVSEFIPGTVLPMDVFMRLGTNKYVLIAKEGEKSAFAEMKAFNNKDVSDVFVRRSEYRRFVSQALEFVSLTQSNKKFRTEHKTFFLRSATAAIFNQVEKFGPSKEVLRYAQTISESTTDMVQKDTSLSSIIKGLHMASPDVFNVSIAVSAFSVMIAKQMDWKSKVTFEKLSLGGLLIDIGLKELPPEIINRPRSELSHEEVQIFEEHPYRGLKMLQTMGNMPDDVLSIVYEHHENSAGMGYPRRLRELRQNPLARVVALAAEFCELTIKTPRNPKPRNVAQALHHIEKVMGQPFSKEAFQALKELVEQDSSSLAA